MELSGFKARAVQQGLSKRTDAHRQSKKKPGPLRAPWLATPISTLRHEQMETLFPAMLTCGVGSGVLEGERLAMLDGSTVPTPPTSEGCGKLKQRRTGKVKGHTEPASADSCV